jgi:hypothetical protein
MGNTNSTKSNKELSYMSKYESQTPSMNDEKSEIPPKNMPL